MEIVPGKLKTPFCLIGSFLFVLCTGIHGTALANDDRNSETMQKSAYRSRKAETYGAVELAFVNFNADGVPDGSARSLGLNFRGGIRLSEIVSLEGGLNWLLIPEILLPVPPFLDARR